MFHSPPFTSRRARHSRTLTLVALVLIAAFGAPTASAAPTITPFETVTLQLDTATIGQPPMLIISGTIPDDAPLPATVRLTVPQGLTLSWAGEVLGGPVEDDPSLKPTFEHGQAGFDTVTLELSKGRVAQLELEAGPLLLASGTDRSVALRWLAPADVSDVHMSVRLPAGSQISTVTPGARTEPGTGGGSIVSLDTSAAAGSTLALDIAHTVSQTASSPVRSGQSGGGAAFVVFAVTAALLALAGMAIMKKARSRNDTQNPATMRPRATHPQERTASNEQAQPVPVERTGPAKRVQPQVVILLCVAVALGFAAFALTSGETVGTTTTTNEHISRVLGDVKADATFSAPLTLSEGDPAHESTHVFDSLANVPGVHVARIVLQGPIIEIEYASGTVDEATIRAALAAAGYIAP